MFAHIEQTSLPATSDEIAPHIVRCGEVTAATVTTLIATRLRWCADIHIQSEDSTDAAFLAIKYPVSSLWTRVFRDLIR